MAATPSLVDVVPPSGGTSQYIFESSTLNSDKPVSKPKLISTDETTPYYQHYFANNDHRVYVAELPDLGPIIVTVEEPEKVTNKKEGLAGGRKATQAGTYIPNSTLRCLIRTKFEDLWTFLDRGCDSISKCLPAAIENCGSKDAKKIAQAPFVKVKNPDIKKELIEMEKKLIPKGYKFGVLCLKKGQKTELEMFQNQEYPKEYHDFLEFLGKKVPLNGFQGFSGGLNTKSDVTGTHSVYETLSGIEIMFHVSSLLPFNPADEQQLERKRHVGNDVVVIIFLEPGAGPFNPNEMTTEFNHIFAVIQPTEDGKYRLELALRGNETMLTTPKLHTPPVFEKNEAFKHFLLTKLVNCERKAMESPSFRTRLSKAKQAQMKLLIEEFSEKKSK